ncbi:hypothetical protein HMPREF1146_0001 [Prevotella sp. MSX73]|nr:hypothetical protein HMPREF1146_0001 [Prevotella sp. MSX73]
MQAGEGELAGLHADAVDVELGGVGLGVGCIEHDARGRLDEVALQYLRHEGERTGGTQVALDDLHRAVFGQILDVERSRDVEFAGYLPRDFLDLAYGGVVDVQGGEAYRGITRVYAGIFDVLGDGIFHHLALVGHGIELYLLGLLHELAHHHGIVFRHLGGHAEETLEFVHVVAHVHGRTREHVGGAHEHGEAHLTDEALDVVERGEGAPGRLVDAQFVEHGRELVAVFGTVDVDGRRAEDGHILPVELHGEVVGYLSAHAHDDALGLFEVDDVEHALLGEFVEIEAVAHVVVGGDGLGVVVDHDGLVAQTACRGDGVDRTPVKLHRRADAVGSRTEHHHRLLVVAVGHVVALGMVGGIEIVGEFGMLAAHGLYALDGRHDVHPLAPGAHLQARLLHVGLALEHEAGYLEVGEARGLHLAHEVGRDVVEPVAGFEPVLEVDDVAQPFEKPLVYLGEFLDAPDGVAPLHGLGDGKDAQVGGVGELLVEVVKVYVVVAHEAVHALAYHAQAFLYHLLKRAADGHDLAHRLHRRPDEAAHAGKLGEVPARNLAYHVVELRSRVGRVGCSHFAYLVERVAQCYLGGHEGERIACGLGSQGRRTGEARVDLDDAVVVGFGVEGKLDVALAHDAQMAHAAHGDVL